MNAFNWDKLVVAAPHLALGRTHLGSIKSFVHDSTEFSLATALRAADKTRVNAALALLGINRGVGHNNNNNHHIYYIIQHSKNT